MKKISKSKSVKPVHKGIAKAPLFKKPKSTSKLVIPKQVEIDENTVKKTKFDHRPIKVDKNNINKSSKNKPKDKKSENNAKKSNFDSKKKCSEDTLIAHDSKNKKNELSENLNVSNIKKPPKKILPSKYVTDEIATKAVIALQKLAELQKKNKIFEEECVVLAQINCIKIQSRKTSLKINLPHSTVASTGEVCLITTDLKKGRKHDHEPSIDHWEEILRKAGVTEVKTVLPMRQLRVEHDQFELKRRLLTRHDFILVDSRIHGHVCHILGKVFHNKHNMLIPVRLHDVKDIKKSIQSALNMSLLHLSEGATSAITIGHMGMSIKQLKENILGLVKELAVKYPGGEHNVRSIHVKLPLSLALPLYVTLRSKKTIGIPKVRSELPKNYKTVEGELTTIIGSTVKITPDGNISVKRNADELMSDNEEEQENFSEDEEESDEPKIKKLKTKKSVKNNKGYEEDQEELSEDKEENSKHNNKKQKTKKSVKNNKGYEEGQEELSIDEEEMPKHKIKKQKTKKSVKNYNGSNEG